jgi:hypothetical protein
MNCLLGLIKLLCEPEEEQSVADADTQLGETAPAAGPSASDLIRRDPAFQLYFLSSAHRMLQQVGGIFLLKVAKLTSKNSSMLKATLTLWRNGKSRR